VLSDAFRLAVETDLRVTRALPATIDPAVLVVMHHQVMDARAPDDLRSGLRQMFHVRIEELVLPIHGPLPATLVSVHFISPMSAGPGRNNSPPIGGACYVTPRTGSRGGVP
jgi:hypothetical protein